MSGIYSLCWISALIDIVDRVLLYILTCFTVVSLVSVRARTLITGNKIVTRAIMLTWIGGTFVYLWVNKTNITINNNLDHNEHHQACFDFKIYSDELILKKTPHLPEPSLIKQTSLCHRLQLPVPHVSPVYPVAHWQLNEFKPFLHRPPLRHGSSRHSLISER